MGGLIEALRDHSVIGIDSAVFIYHIEADPKYSDVADVVISSLATEHYTGVTSVVSLMEVTVKPLQAGRFFAANRYTVLISRIPNLSVVPIDRTTAFRAAQLRAAHRLNSPDALQVAACMQHGATAYVTNDLRLRGITQVDIIMLEDYIES